MAARQRRDMKRAQGISSKIAIVTGASRGIGLAIAKRLLNDGFHVIATCRTKPRQSHGLDYQLLNVTQSAEVKTFFAQFKNIDVLVNNAGVSSKEEGIEAWDHVIQTNLAGTYYCSHFAEAKMSRNGGRIINIASILGLRGVPDQVAYVASKHGIIGLTRALALKLARRGITVNAICPGWVATEMAKRRFKDIGITRSQAESSVPLGRIGSVSEVAAMVSYLSSPSAAYITGQTLIIDGGSCATI